MPLALVLNFWPLPLYLWVWTLALPLTLLLLLTLALDFEPWPLDLWLWTLDFAFCMRTLGIYVLVFFETDDRGRLLFKVRRAEPE